jgi:hypothetical protein
LVREPIAAIYSSYRLRQDRLGEEITDLREWIDKQLNEYADFYRRALSVKSDVENRFLMLHYEELVEDATALETLCKFVGVQPKLKPSFVRYITNFESFAIKGERTFYRSGQNDSWKQDELFVSLIASATYPDIPELGYNAPALLTRK